MIEVAKKMVKRLSDSQVEFIKENASKMSCEDIAKELGLPARKARKEIERLKQKGLLKKKAQKLPDLTVASVKDLAPNKRPFFFVSLLIVFVLTFAVYANTLGNDFIWDDEYLILKNAYVKSFSHIGSIFTHYLGYASGNVNNFYRPLQGLTNMVDYVLWNGSPKGFHLSNTLFHGVAAILTFYLIFLITGDMLVGLFAGLLFGIHPMHTEAVAYIAGRADPLYFIFFLGSLILYAEWARRRIAANNDNYSSMIYYILSMVLFGASILSKEIALVLPLVILLFQFSFFRNRMKEDTFFGFSSIPFFLLVIVYAFLRSNLLNIPTTRSIFANIPVHLRLFTSAKSIMVYFRIFLLPIDLHMERRILISRGFLEPETFLSVSMILALLSYAAIFFKRQRLLTFSILWFFICLIPVSNVVPINSFIAEHWVYAASIGIFLPVSLAVVRLIGPGRKEEYIMGIRIATITLFVFLIGWYSYITVNRNNDWKDEISFFESSLKYSPRNATLYLNLGNTYSEKGMDAKALEQYEKAIDLRPNFAEAYGNIGSIYLSRGELAKAEERIRKAIAFEYGVPDFHYNLAKVHFLQNRYDEALKELEVTTNLLPAYYEAYNLLARIYELKQDRLQAVKCLQKSLSIRPDQPTVRRKLQIQK